MKQNCKKILVDKHKQGGSSRQNDKLEQWVMDSAVEVDVLGLILGSKKKFFFPCLNVFLI